MLDRARPKAGRGRPGIDLRRRQASMMRILRPAPAALALLLLVAPAATAWGQAVPVRSPQVPDLKVEKYTLPNGLEVILHQDPTIPVVAVDVWYKVGSKDEKVGRTGFAHLFEHVMFQGSQHHDKEYFEPLENLGANINGSTSEDRTNYFEVLPSNGLERALWLEADRMGFLLPALTQAKLDNQREVVKNERRQRVDNQPYGLAEEALIEALYPKDHPYHHSVIGSMADLSAASLDDVQNFFRTYYAPNNASLVIAGAFDADEAKSLVAKYFGPIPRGPEITRPTPSVPKLDGEKHVSMTDRVTLARTQLVWPTVPANHPDEAALDVLAAVLGSLPKENRLYRALQYDNQLATSTRASHPTQMLAGTFEVDLTARPGGELDELVKRADAEIARMKAEGPTADEVAKAQTERETGFVFGLQSTLRKAELFNSGNVTQGDPLAYKTEMEKFFAVTPEDVKRVANQYLGAGRVRLDVTPGAQATRPPEVEVNREGQVAIAPVKTPAADTFDRNVMPPVGKAADFTPPPVVRRKLSNGAEVLIAERHELPVLTLSLMVRGGAVTEPRGKEGLASLTGSLMSEGTAKHDVFQLAGALSEIGSSLRAGFGAESGSLSLTTLTKHADTALGLFAEVLTEPSFPEPALERLRAQRVAGLLRRKDNPGQVAGMVFPKLLYGGDHPYGRIDTVDATKSITREDVVDFYKSSFVPENATFIVVGDVDPDAIVAKLETALAGWKAGAEGRKAPELATPEAPGAGTLYLVDKPGAAQSVLNVGHLGASRTSPDYFPIEVMNAVLGGQFSSRINMNLREDKGYSYGARSGYQYVLGPGSFEASTSVQTAVTAPALSELVKELTEVGSTRPITPAEFEFAKGNLVRGYPGEFETTMGLAGKIADLAMFGLPADYFTTYESKLEAVSLDDVNRVAKQYVHPDNLLILVVGDRATIEPGLKALPFVKKIVVLDPEGEPVK
jgi:zinc protease